MKKRIGVHPKTIAIFDAETGKTHPSMSKAARAAGMGMEALKARMGKRFFVAKPELQQPNNGVSQ